MAKDMMEYFNDLIKQSSKFVGNQKGEWSHSEWLDFLSGFQKKGIDINNDIQDTMGAVVESMKNVYSTMGKTKNIEKAMQDISDTSVSFMKKTSGSWDQAGWDTYLKDLQKKGVDFTEESKGYLGSVLESVKVLYNKAPASAKSASK